MTMSKCSSIVFTVYGLVGSVEEGKALGSPAIFMMSGACPPPAPSVWYVWTVRPSIASIESSTYPPSFSESVCMDICTSYSSATLSPVSSDACVAPQSSCILNPPAPAASSSTKVSFLLSLAFPKNSQLIGRPSVDSIIFLMFHGPGVHVVALVPSAGPVPPPT